MARDVALLGAAGTLAACSAPAAQKKLPEPAWPSTSALERHGRTNLPVPGKDWPESPQGLSPLSSKTRAAADRIHQALPDVRALLILDRGALVYERYFDGAARTTSFNVKSVTKSIISALIGIAIARGDIDGLDHTVSTWLPELAEEGADPRLRTLRVRHLLDMTAGFRWEENGPSTTAWMRSRDYVRFLRDSALDAAPGERFNYSTAVAHLLSVILTRATKTPTKQFADEQLFGPIGVRAGAWSRDPQGYHEGGSELHLTARDMARFGLLYLNQGQWDGRTVVPREWVFTSTRPQRRIDYGLLWSNLPPEWGGPAVNALGYGGQLIAIVPDAEVVIVIASTTHNPQNDVTRFLREALLPAVRGRPDR